MEDRIVDAFFIVGVLTILVLKLMNIITIPWLWLTAIIWIPFSIGVVLALVILILFIISIIKEKK